LTRYIPHAAFSWPVFVGLAVFILAIVLPFVVRIISSVLLREITHRSDTPTLRHSDTHVVASHGVGPPLADGLEFGGEQARALHHSFPPWGWIGLAFGACAWVLAWTRFPWFAPLQPFTFSPLWFSYIIVVNALAQWRTGQCMMLSRTRYFLCLFPVSAGFWWFFEYLNRFVQNWYYVGVTGLTPLQYFVFATLPFSTVLPPCSAPAISWLRSRPRPPASTSS